MSNNYPTRTKIMGRLVTARVRDEWISVKDLALATKTSTETAYKTLKRLLEDNMIVRRRIQPTRGRWYYVYQASDVGHVRHELGGPPRGSEKLSKQELDVIVRSITEVVDTARVKWEHRQVVVTLDPYIAGVLRVHCPKPKKGDRAKQVTCAGSSFVMVIAKTGVATITLRDPMTWDTELSNWLQKTGISKAAIQVILKQVWNQLPGGTTRAEIPVLEQAIKRLQVQCRVETKVDGDKVVESNINYSMNEIGLEYFGTTRWVDALVRTLIGLQHSTVISEVSRDQYIEDVWKAIEQLRKEYEKKEEAEKAKKGGPDYVV